MTRAARLPAAAATAALTVALLAGCGRHHTPAAGTPSPAGSASRLADMRKLVDDADAAAATADADAAGDK
ncbi:hypothetical protein OG552_33780 [Streptomyces sp. NBC_01476]|uniref:hypothetical protein n=1 Tax=Streptomyces sp. NBC_01476 TaxID=2903881 RepID=UPI002E2EDF03|nr:hypothetical protein [Streptomyces sp. NBC_01476]